MWGYDDSRAAVRDALRLSRGMTYKSAVAGLPLGGGKGVIMLPPDGAVLGPRRRRAVLHDFADTVEALQGRYVTAEDVGTSTRDMQAIAQVTSHVSGLPRRQGGSGDPSPWTALGVEAAIVACCERVFGTTSMRGRSVAVVGLGHVGLRLARLLARRRAQLVVADIDEAKRGAAEGLGARWMTPAQALVAGVDVLAPCALGGVLDHESVPRLQAQVVAGAANNQLERPEHARALQEAGILYAPDYVINAGGLINVADELRGYDEARALERVRGIYRSLRAVFHYAETKGIDTAEAADRFAEERMRKVARLRTIFVPGERGP
jgi:leucine dehydrogenase